jgi:hypothetical protein
MVPTRDQLSTISSERPSISLLTAAPEETPARSIWLTSWRFSSQLLISIFQLRAWPPATILALLAMGKKLRIVTITSCAARPHQYRVQLTVAGLGAW